MNLVHGEMKVNIFFKRGADVGAIADTLVDIAQGAVGAFTAFNLAPTHKATNGNELHVAQHQDINLFTDFKTFITVDPLSERGETIASLFIQTCANGEDMTHIDAHELVVSA